MSCAIIVRRLQSDDDIAVVGQGQSSFRNRSDITLQEDIVFQAHRLHLQDCESCRFLFCSVL